MASFYGSRAKRRKSAEATTSQSVVESQVDLDDFDLLSDHEDLDDTGGNSGINDFLSSHGTGSMYSFEGIQDSTPLSRSAVKSTEPGVLPESGFCTPRHSQHQSSFDSSGSHCSVVRRRDSSYVPDLLERQNNLILELLSEPKKNYRQLLKP